LLHIDLPSRDQLRALFEHRAPASVTLYVPTTPLTQDAQADRVVLSNLAREALGKVEAAGPPRGALAGLSEQLEGIAEDDALWRLQARTLAVFATPERAVMFRLPTAIEAQAWASDRFHATPMLRAVAFPPACHVLAIGAGGARLLEVPPEGPVEVLRVEGMPDDAADAVGKASIKDRSHSQRIVGSEGEKVRLRQYARAVDRAVRARLLGDELPLLLAAGDKLGPIFRSVSALPRLDGATLEATPDTHTDEQIAALARARLDARRAEELAALRDTFAARREAGRATADLSTAARAAAMGAVDTLLVDMDCAIPGLLDEETGEILVDGAADGLNYGVADGVARRVLAHGGRVVPVRADELPEGADSPVAALLRHALIRAG
jgi:hypothetical protein